MKLLEKNIGLNLYNLGFGSGFLDMTPKSREQKQKNDKLNFTKIKAFVHERTL